MSLLDTEPDFYSMPPLVEDSQDESFVPNVFADGQKYLPVTALMQEKPAAVAPLVQVQSRPSMLVSSPRTVSSSSSSDSDNDESHHCESTLNQALPQAVTTQLASTPPARLVSTTTESATTQQGGASFINELNETIFMHELAMGCSILCQLRRGGSNL